MKITYTIYKTKMKTALRTVFVGGGDVVVIVDWLVSPLCTVRGWVGILPPQ